MAQQNFRRPNEKSSTEKHKINQYITAREVRVIGEDGAQLGVLATREAIRIAEDAGLDLVEVAANVNPPVCKILDYGKLKYREQKKAAEARKKSAVQDTKELRVRYSIDPHDLETKIRNARKFIEDGDKVRFQMRFKGREVVYQELGEEIFKKIIEALQDITVIDERGPLIGSRMHITFAPKPHGK